MEVIMRRNLVALCGLLIGGIFACSPALAERRVALVIGNAHYANTNVLRNSVNDAEDVAAELKQLGFDVTLATDLDESAFAQQIDNFGRRLEGADVGLFYYAGHGLQVNDKNYLVATNARLESEFLVPSETILVDAIIRLMESRAGVNLVFLDACRDNPLADNLRRSLISEHRSVSLGRGLARMEPTGRQTLVAFSAAPGESAEDGNGRNSPFAAALLQRMPEPGVEVSVMLKQVSADVREATHSAQRPQQVSDMAEPFYFAGTAAAVAAKPPSAAADSSVELAFFQTAVAANDCAAMRSYLTRYPQGIFVELARLSEQRLCGAPARAAESEHQLKSEALAAPVAAAPLIKPPDSAASPQAAEPNKPAAPAAAFAALPPASTPAPAPIATETARNLQSELLRVGCGAAELTTTGDWGDESRSALAQFNRFAKTNFTGPSQAALAAVHSHQGRVCPLVCGEGMRAEGNTCVAEPQQHPHAKRQAERPHPRSRDSAQRTSRPPRDASRSHDTSADNGIPTLKSYQGSTSPFGSLHGMKCYTLDEAGLAPRIVCH
jgi:uncharacterized caspase-like protein